ncbi:hypothetical protein BV392_11515 [Rhodovulum sulfidophilum]|nr:hypothetical protein BV392_11515 [Rhodovulum sulfidophilum]
MVSVCRSFSDRAFSRSHCMGSAAASSCGLFTITEKKTMSTTAASDCQSKPNHITRIGAVPTMGRRYQIANRHVLPLQEGRAVDGDGRQHSRAAA